MSDEKKLNYPWLKVVVDYRKRKEMISYAENFFRCMDDEKLRRQKEQEEWNEKCCRLDTIATKKLLKVIDPFIQEQNGMYKIIYDAYGKKAETMFSSKSRKKTFKKWNSYTLRKREECRVAVVVNGKELRLYYWYSIIGKSVDDFLGKRNEILHQKLLELDEWAINLWRKARGLSKTPKN